MSFKVFVHNFILSVLAFFTNVVIGQPDTEVYLFDLVLEDGTYMFQNKRNISNNEGYDNQPYFYNDNQVLFASTRNGQTDIASYNIRDKTINWINSTLQGSEYSPTKIPNKKAVSSIRLDTTGLQRLYEYSYKSGKNKELIKDLVIGYHTWYNKHIIISAVLEDGGLDLVVSNLKTKTNKTLVKKIGRSLHKTPNTNLVSFISKEKEPWTIKSIDPVTGAINTITEVIDGKEDMCWLLNGVIHMPSGNTIYYFNPNGEKTWKVLTTFDDPRLQKISRIAVNSLNNQIVLVSE